MSTVAEHLAMVEFYQVTENKENFDIEANLLVRVHLKELIESINSEEMKYARKHVRQALLDISPSLIPLIEQWEKTLVSNSPSQVS